jgi:hypothetical protein
MSTSPVSSRFPFVLDEGQIARSVGHAVPTLRIFTLEGLGIDKDQFLSFLRPTFSLLHIDQYDPKRNRLAFLKKRFPDESRRLDEFLVEQYSEHADLDAIADLLARLAPADLHEFDRIGLTNRRKRSIARFQLRPGGHSAEFAGDTCSVTRVGAQEFRQNVGANDSRSLVRKFHEAPEFVTDFPPMQHLVRCLANMVLELRPDARGLEINLHQMFVFADTMAVGDNAPEGIHQDGTDYIVSALVIERAGILGGESIVYGPDKKTEYLRRTLQPGEGIFQADKGSELWHYVTSIREDPDTPPDYGHRSIIGFDVDIV